MKNHFEPKGLCSVQVDGQNEDVLKKTFLFMYDAIKKVC